MTAAIDGFRSRLSEPAWCTDHFEPSDNEVLHGHDFRQSWGTAGEKVRVGLARFDTDDALGPGHVEIVYLGTEGDVDGSVSLGHRDAEAVAASLLVAVATQRRAGHSRPALLVHLVYAFGKAFAAAMSRARASSP